MASLNPIAEAAFLDTIFSGIFAQCILLIARSNHPVLLFTEMQFPTLDLIGLDHVDEEEEADLMRPFLAVVERQGLCEFQVKHSPDGTPFLCAIPSAEIAAQSLRDGMNLNCACVRSTKNIRGDFKCCLRLDTAQTWVNPTPQKLVLCFMDEGEYSRAARAIREAQHHYFGKLRRESQPYGATNAAQLVSASVNSSASLSMDIKVKVGVSEESLKCVSVDGEVLVIESKSKGSAGVLRSKRIIIPTVGLPISFVNPTTISVPSRHSDVYFMFPDSLARDLFAYKLFLHSKGDPRAAVFRDMATASLSSSQKTRMSRTKSADSVFVNGSPTVVSGSAIYKQGFLHKQGAFVKSWKTRYFVLRPGDLSYFHSKDEALHGEVPLNTFFLRDATIEIVPFSKHVKSCVFEIQFSTSSGNKNRTLVLEAQSETDRQEWVDALISHLDTDSDRSRVVALQDVDQVTGANASALSIDDFDLLCTLGQGAFGKVLAARHKHTNITFALKIMKKRLLVEHNAVNMIIRERRIMSELLHPFIVNLYGHFSTPTKLYMVLRLAPGGDISKMIARQERNDFCFSSSVAQFVIAQVILAIEYMHGRGILHRDIKTENILIDENGYCLLADMGLACLCEEVTALRSPSSPPVANPATSSASLWAEPSIKKHENHIINQRQGSTMRANRSSFLGTPEYLAPELLNFKGRREYGSSCDWWAVGILLYELLNGHTPFQGQTPEAIYSRILLDDITFGPDISEEAQDLILQLCTKDPRKRLCCSPGNGVEQLRNHAFFRDFDWTNLFCRRMPSPFRGLVGCVQEDAQTRDSVVSDTLTEQQQALFADFI